MREFKKRRGFYGELGRTALRTAALLSLGALAFFAARGAYEMYGKFAGAAAAREAAAAELAALESRHKGIAGDVEGLESPRGVEEEIRERYGVARPGEGQIEIVRTVGDEVSAPSAPKGILESLWHLLFVW